MANPLKTKLLSGGCAQGLWLNLGAGVAAEVAGRAGFDWCLIDGEHAPFDMARIESQVLALAGTATQTCLRVPVGEDWIIKQVLDLGVQNILVPMIDTADQARAMVAAVRYPPHGVRGLGSAVARASFYGEIADYPVHANDDICLMVQVETTAALQALPEICAVEGVDVVFIGPADLAASMGYIHDLGHPDVRRVIQDALDQIMAAGKVAGILALEPEAARGYRDQGVGFIGVGSDALLLAGALRGLRDRI